MTSVRIYRRDRIRTRFRNVLGRRENVSSWPSVRSSLGKQLERIYQSVCGVKTNSKQFIKIIAYLLRGCEHQDEMYN